jgi:molecular chaperone Hsp33
MKNEEGFMQDYFVRAVMKTGNVQGIACVTTQLVQTACQIHHTNPTASVALGRALTGGAMMGSLLGEDQRVALKFEGNGPLKKILVEANRQGEVRGYVGVPDVDVPLKNGKIDVASAIGRAGLLTVTKDLGLKTPYEGIVQLYTSEIGEDLAFYLMESEQIPSAVGLGVFIEPDGTVVASGGFLLQSLPPANETLIEQLVHQIGQLPPLTEFLKSGQRPEDLLNLIFADIPFDLTETQALAFKCSCSRERMERGLIALGTKDLANLIEEGDAEIVCEFCRKQYLFTREQLQQLLVQIQ